jgi:predicted alpha/beta-fold hydrolase
LNANTELIIHERGGHNGFIEDVFTPAWYAKKALSIFNGIQEESEWGSNGVAVNMT